MIIGRARIKIEVAIFFLLLLLLLSFVDSSYQNFRSETNTFQVLDVDVARSQRTHLMKWTMQRLSHRNVDTICWGSGLCAVVRDLQSITNVDGPWWMESRYSRIRQRSHWASWLAVKGSLFIYFPTRQSSNHSSLVQPLVPLTCCHLTGCILHVS